MKTIPFSIASKNPKIPRNKPITKDLKDLYKESYKTLKKACEEDTRKFKDLPYLQIVRNNNVKMTIGLI
jgi:hypothetical protein